MVRSKAPAKHFDTSGSFSAAGGDAAVHQVIYPDSPHRSSSVQKYNASSTPKRLFVQPASKKAMFKRNSRGFRRYRPGQKALKEIRHFQKTTDLLIQTAPFVRLVREVAQEMTRGQSYFRFQTEALLALQEGAEAFLIYMFEQANYMAIHASRVTLQPRDIQLWRRIKEF